MEKKGGDGDMERTWKKRSKKETGRETRKARHLGDEGGYCSLHLKVRGYFKEGRFKKRIIIFSALVLSLY